MAIIVSLLYILSLCSAVWYVAAILLLFRGMRNLRTVSAPQGNRFSVVIAARNEEDEIAACLDSVFQQTIDSGRFEVIVVNDRSTDATPSIVNDYKKLHDNLHLITITATPPNISPKKFAVSQGVTVAANDIIVFTDADCRVPPAWLSTIDRYFTSTTGVVQGFTSYFDVPGINRALFAFQSIDFISHGVVAACAIGAGLPINSNANNFSFRKEALLDISGMFDGIGHVVSGDDDLLLQKIWMQKKWQLVFMTDREGAVTTRPSTSITEIFQQRSRWGSKTVHYKPQQILLLSGIFMFYLCILMLAISTPFLQHTSLVLFALLLLKLSGESLLMIPMLVKMKKANLLAMLPLASLLQLPLVVFALVFGVFGKFTWKGQSFSRTIKRKNDDT